MESEFSAMEQYTQLSATVNFYRVLNMIQTVQKNNLIRTFHLNFQTPCSRLYIVIINVVWRSAREILNVVDKYVIRVIRKFILM